MLKLERFDETTQKIVSEKDAQKQVSFGLWNPP